MLTFKQKEKININYIFIHHFCHHDQLLLEVFMKFYSKENRPKSLLEEEEEALEKKESRYTNKEEQTIPGMK